MVPGQQQRYPAVSAVSRVYPRPYRQQAVGERGLAEAGEDGVTTVYFSPSKPASVKDANWIQTVPGRGWFVILRLYSPLEPFFANRPVTDQRTCSPGAPPSWPGVICTARRLS